jgi:hypothetical protein
VSYAYRTLILGEAATPAGDLFDVKTIAGKSSASGDGSDAQWLANESGWVGRIENGNRFHTLFRLDIDPDKIKPTSRLISTDLVLHIDSDRGWAGGTVSGAYVEIWRVARTLPSGYTGTDWDEYATGQTWDRPGILFGPGSDTDSSYITRFEWTQADQNTGSATKTIPLNTAVQEAIDSDEAVQLAFRPTWSNTLGGDNLIILLPPADNAPPHTRLEVRYRFPREFYGANVDGTRNVLDLKDASVADLARAIYVGAPPRGSESSAVKVYVANETTGAQPAVVVHGGQTQIGSINHTGVSGDWRLRTVRGYSTTGSTQTPSGTWRIVYDGANVDIYFTPEGSDTEESLAANQSTGSDITVTRNALTALIIPYEGAGLNWSGTPAADDEITFATRGDLHSSSAPLSTLDQYYLHPHAAADRASALTTYKRQASHAVTQQLCSWDERTVSNSGGSTAVCVNVSDGGTWTHIKVPDPMRYTVGDYAQLAEWGASDETGDNGRVEHVKILARYDIDDATYPGQLRIAQAADGTTALTTPADFDGQSVFTTGIWLGRLERPKGAFLAEDASTSSQTVTLDAPLTVATGTVTITDLETGDSETRTISSTSGTSVTFTAAPSTAWPAGSLVSFDDDSTSECPFFVTAAPTSGEARGKKTGYIVNDSWSVV